jgi:hypothetical protein
MPGMRTTESVFSRKGGGILARARAVGTDDVAELLLNAECCRQRAIARLETGLTKTAADLWDRDRRLERR